MAGTETGAEWNRLHQTGKCIFVDRGFRQSSEVFGPLLFPGLAATAQPLRQKDQSADGGSSEEHVKDITDSRRQALR